MPAALDKEAIKAEASHVANGSGVAVNNWSTPGQSAYDFRSVYLLPSHVLLVHDITYTDNRPR